MRRRIVLVIAIATLTLAVTVAPAFGARGAFRAHLRGANEVPAVSTRATGQSVMRLSADGMALDYKLIVSNIKDITAAHIHLGPAGANGPVVALLTTAHPGTSHGMIAQGRITAANLVGPMAGMDLADLVEQMRAGNTYVNVHTTVNPGGAIRGQIR